jgi:DNA polymerase
MSTNKKELLEELQQEIINDKNLPLLESNLVFGEGNPDCDVLFIGEAPGQKENELERPFVGRSGKLLDQLIGELGWKREDVYISNIVKRRPPENRDPTPEEIESYKPYLAKQIAIINPKVIAPLGRFSMNYFLPFAKISTAHGKVFTAEGHTIFPLYHPAAALRATSMLNDLREDFKKLPKVVSGDFLKEFAEKNLPPKIETKKKEKPPQIKLF